MALPKLIKLSCGTTTRKIKLPKCFDELVLQATKLFPDLRSLSKNNELTFFYVDEDKEIIAISNNDDFEVALESDPVPTRFYTGHDTNDVSKSIHQNEELKAQLTSRMEGNISFQQENSIYEKEVSKVEEGPQSQFNSSQDFSILSHEDARIGADEFLRMQKERFAKNNVPYLPINQAKPETVQPAAAPVVEEKKEPEAASYHDVVMQTEVQEKSEKMSSAIVDTSEQEMQSEQIQCSNKLCESRPVLNDVALDARSVEAEEQQFAKKSKREKKGKKGDKLARVLEIIREEIRTRVPVIFKQLMEQELEKKEGGVQREIIAHEGVICDGCGAKPIIGVRYKCTVRQNFDLCERCEATLEQPYAMLKIKKPALAPKSLIVHQEQNEEIPGADPVKVVVADKYMRVDVDVAPAPVAKKKEEVKVNVWERNKKQSIVKMLKCRYVREHPEGELVVYPGEQFEKTYTLRNDGDDEWPESATLCYVGGDDLGFEQKEIGRVDGRGETTFKLTFTAPKEEGRYTSYLRMCERFGEARFGHRFWCSVVVKMPEVEPVEPVAGIIAQPAPEPIVVEQAGEPIKPEEVKENEPLNDSEINSSSAFNDPPEVEELHPLMKDPRYFELKEDLQVQVMNLWNTGITDASKLLDLMVQHKNNIPQVANDLFKSHA